MYRTIISIVKRKQLKFLEHQIREQIIINVIALKVTVMLILMIIMTLMINKLAGINVGPVNIVILVSEEKQQQN